VFVGKDYAPNTEKYNGEYRRGQSMETYTRKTVKTEKDIKTEKDTTSDESMKSK
jgi:hypothetical protein